MTDELFTIRDATDEDLPVIDAYAYAEGMDDMPNAEGIRVAVEASGAIVGFCRMFRADDGNDYVRPMVTYPTWRGYGVGRALIEDALARSNGQLLLISRGWSKAFYTACSFEDATWEDLDEVVREDCTYCEMREECNPQPMRRVRSEALQ